MSGTEKQALDAGTPDGRELSPAVVILSSVVGGISLTVGALLAVTSLTGHAAGAWVSPEALSPGLVGAAMAGVAPALFTLGKTRVWEEARTLVLPLVIVLVGLFAVSLLNGGSLQAVHGGPLFLALFSLGWVATLGLLALAAVVCLVAQYRRPAPPSGAERPRVAPVPGWSKPLLAVLGSGWLGIGAGLLALPAFSGPPRAVDGEPRRRAGPRRLGPGTRRRRPRLPRRGRPGPNPPRPHGRPRGGPRNRRRPRRPCPGRRLDVGPRHLPDRPRHGPPRDRRLGPPPPVEGGRRRRDGLGGVLSGRSKCCGAGRSPDVMMAG